MMEPDDLVTPAGTARALRTLGVRPRKRWGQHFLVSRRARERILTAADICPHDTILEIGAGLGTLTTALAASAGRVIAVEIDRALLPALEAAVAPWHNVQVVAADILSLDLAAVFGTDARSRKVVANLPFNVASKVVATLLEQPLALQRLVVTVQREVAERMAASPGTKDYGILSVAVQYRASVSVVTRLPASAFFPAPEVESAVVRLDVLDEPSCAVPDERMFFRVVRAAFGQRRKTVRNALTGGIPMAGADAEAACWQAGIEPRRRGETMTLQEFAALTGAVATLLRRRSLSPMGEGA